MSKTILLRRLTVSPFFVSKKRTMKRVIAIADRTALASLRLLVALNVLFFLSFLIIALLAAGKARAETPACAGVDMLSALRKDDPVTYRKIETEAAATPNGKGLLWKLEKAGERPSFLFGTMHMSDPRVTTLPPAAQKAFDAADTIVIETTEVLDQQKMNGGVPERAGTDDVHRQHHAVLAAVAGRCGGGEQGARLARHPAGECRQDETVDAVDHGRAPGL